MFADNTKLFCTITKTEDFYFLQSDNDKLNEWSKRWHLNFNSDTSKCKVLTIGNRFLHALGRFKYRLGGSEMHVTDSERDFGVIMDEDFKFESHVRYKVNKAIYTIYFALKVHNITVQENNICTVASKCLCATQIIQYISYI